jgi:hypothetical protein
MAAAGSDKRQVRPSTDYFEKLLEETCPNHTYLVKQKLRDYDMMKIFMASGSLTRIMEADDAPNESNTPSFPGEDTVMTVYDGCPLPRTHHMSNPS